MANPVDDALTEVAPSENPLIRDELKAILLLGATNGEGLFAVSSTFSLLPRSCGSLSVGHQSQRRQGVYENPSWVELRRRSELGSGVIEWILVVPSRMDVGGES